MTQHDDEMETSAIKYAPQNVYIDSCLRKAFKAGARWQAEKTKELVAENARLIATLKECSLEKWPHHDCFAAKLAASTLLDSNGNALAAIREAMDGMQKQPYFGNYIDGAGKQLQDAFAKLRGVFGE